MKLRDVCLVLTMGAGAAWGQAGAMAGMDMEPVPPPESLPAPVAMTGIGNASMKIKANAAAQVWFDQGLNLLHDFWDYEAAKAFEQAVRVDPTCAMCEWGLARAEGFRGNAQSSYGKKALAQAVRLREHASGTGKLYIDAAMAESGNKEKEATAIYRKLVNKQPKNIQARIFLAESLGDGYDGNGEPKPGQAEAIAILAAVLKDAPNDSAANHYWIHAIEPGNHPERALPSAALLAALAPNSGHMVHMPGHIYYRVGDYANADKWFAASTAVDEAYLHTQHVRPDDDWNYVHNMMYGIANLMEQGRLADADALSDRLAGARGRLSATLYVWSARDQMARVSYRLPVALRVGDWNGVLRMLDEAKLPEKDNTANLRFLQMELRNFATGMRALEAGDVAAAKQASLRMDAELYRGDTGRKVAADEKKPMEKRDAPPMEMVMPDADAGSLAKSLAVASLELRAGVLIAEGKLEPGKKLYAQAAKDEKELGYHEPPVYIRPVGESEAAALLRAKDYAGAAAAYREALLERPDSGFELYGLARVQELEQNAAGARTAYARFLKAWPTADAELPEVVHARQVVGNGSSAAQ